MSASPQQTAEIIELKKTCRDCKQEKPYSLFPRNKSTKDGYELRCCACMIIRRREKGTLEQKRIWREQRKLKPKNIPEYMTCTKCKVEKPTQHFYRRPEYPNGISTQCRKCIREYNNLYEKNHPEFMKRKREKDKFPNKLNLIKKKYGLSHDAYVALYDSQAGRCLICKNPVEKFTRNCHVDHSHSTGKVRGILCRHCNTGLGLFFDNPELLEMAAKYLRDRSK